MVGCFLAEEDYVGSIPIARSSMTEARDFNGFWAFLFSNISFIFQTMGVGQLS